MKVLLVEDDIQLAAAIAEYLEIKDIDCDFAYTGHSALELAHQNASDAIVLDMMLPGLNGFEVCRQLRVKGFSIPVLMLTSADSEHDQLEGFDCGVDDYVIKPCSMPLLLARLNALCHRVQPKLASKKIGDLIVKFEEQRAIRADIEICLTPTCWKILELLARESPKMVSKSMIEDYVWPDSEPSFSNLNVQLHFLRKAIDKPFEMPLIHTHVGSGISLREPK